MLLLFSTSIPKKYSPSTPSYLPPPNLPEPSTQSIPYPLHSPLTSEPTSFRKPSPIKEARVRIPSSPRHHEQTTTPPILAVHIYQNKTKNNKINKINKNKKTKKKRRGNVYVCPSCCFSLSAPRGQGPCLPNGLCSADCGKYLKKKQSQQKLNGGPVGSWGLELYFEIASASCP